MLGWFVLLFTLYLSAALLSRKRPGDGERRGAMCSFGLLAPVMIGDDLPLSVLTVTTVYFAFYLRKTFR